MNAHQRVSAGLSRSYQITNIFKQSSVLDNLVLAVQAHAGSSFRFWKPRAAESALYEQARELARECAIDASLLGRPAGTLPHGEQRKVEFALALAARPSVLLLDEPMAGMGPDETVRLTELIETLRGRAAMLLVEHDMQAVFRLADRLPARAAGQGRLIVGALPQDGRPGLLFVPGAYHGAWCFAHYLDYFAAAGLACAALDLRGHGALPQDAAFASTTIADLGQDVAHALDALEGPTVVVGHSMGALPALLAARQRPVAGVVLMAPSPPGDLPGALALPPVPDAVPRTAPAPRRRQPAGGGGRPRPPALPRDYISPLRRALRWRSMRKM
ncbi:hypothetical protein G6F35_012179 [Rhizopus arrhizus]|nr:hypothetical protein G6F35_012179 [Rhizopus arrhizus]